MWYILEKGIGDDGRCVGEAKQAVVGEDRGSDIADGADELSRWNR